MPSRWPATSSRSRTSPTPSYPSTPRTRSRTPRAGCSTECLPRTSSPTTRCCTDTSGPGGWLSPARFSRGCPCGTPRRGAR
uniref:Uncharacterized protein n=1 Tax=Arundo donax TaxID=35708 RepID=A0A0A8YSB1_ARUDO